MSILKKLAGDTALYGFSTIIGRFINFLLIPVYTRVFQPSEYGVITEFYSYIAFLNIIYTYGMETGYFRFATKSIDLPITIYSKIQSQLICTTFLFTIIILSFSTYWSVLLQHSSHPEYLICTALILAIDALSALPFARLRLENKARAFALIKLITILINVFLNFFFLVWCPVIYKDIVEKSIFHWIYEPSLGILYVFIANIISNAFGLVLLITKSKQFRFILDLSFFKNIASYSIPILIIGLAGMVNEVADRILLKYLLPEGYYMGVSNITAVGIYGACYKLSIFMTLGIQAFRYASEPFFFSQSQRSSSPAFFATVMHWFIICCCAVFLFVSINLGLIKHLLGNPLYFSGLSIVPILLLSNLFLGVYYNLSMWFKLSDRTHYGMYISLLGAFVTLILNYILIPSYGYMGCAVTTFIVYFLMCLLSYVGGQKFYPIPYSAVRMLGYIFLAMICYYALNNYYNLTENFVLFANLIGASFIAIIVLIEKRLQQKSH